MNEAERKAAAAVMASDGPWQERARTRKEWHDSPSPVWNWACGEYRVKPLKAVGWINIYGRGTSVIHATREAADNAYGSDGRSDCVRIEYETRE